MDLAKQFIRGYKTKGMKRIPVKPIPLPITKTEIARLASGLDLMTRNLIYALYLTGARASEIIKLESKHFDEKPAPEGIKQFTVFMHVLKKRSGNPYRTIPLRGSTKIEEEMLLSLINYKDRCPGKLFPLHRTTVWRKLKDLKFTTGLIYSNPYRVKEEQEQHMYPHFLRHCRATHLVQDYGFDPFTLMHYIGWSSLEPARVYVNFDWRTPSRLLLSLRDQH